MKNLEFVKAYVNGKKSAFYLNEGKWYLMHYVRGLGMWKEQIPFKNRKGFFGAVYLCTEADGFDTAQIEAGAILGGMVWLEGTDEYNAIRAEVENNGRRAKRPSRKEEQPKQEASKKEDTTKSQAKQRKSDEVRDPNFDLIVKAIRRNRNVYLWGPAGSGKTTIARQVAEELGLPFYCQGIVNDKFEFEGSQDPRNGSDGYLPSTFYKAFTQGGVYCLDEIDGCDPGQLSFLNAALANRVANFPVIGTVKAHPDFRFIATGNTNGFGPTEMYMTRFAFDSATVDRFNDVIRIDYNRKVERAAARGNMEVVDFIHDLRKVLNEIKNGQIVCGYRMIGNLAEAVDETEFGEALYTARQAVEFSVMRGIEGDMVRMIAGQIKDSDNQFTRALKEYAKVAI